MAPSGPTWIDRAIGWISPQAGMRRLAARHALRQLLSYDASSRGPRTQGWKAPQQSPNSALALSLETLRARSRDLIRNEGWGKAAVAPIVRNTVGYGILAQLQGAEGKKLEQLQAAWKAWADSTDCDADGQLDLAGLQALVMQTIVESGSVLIRRRWRRASDGLPVPLQLQVLEPDHLDAARDTLPLEGGNRILRGIEFDAIGRRRGYWLLPNHPGDGLWPWGGANQSHFIPATEILHIYRLDRAGQVDGVPWMHPVILKMRDLGEFGEARLLREKIAACFAAFVLDPDAPQTPAPASKEIQTETIEPGTIVTLPAGKQISFATPPTSVGSGEHVKTALQEVAASLGVTYEALSGDYSQVNFSSARMGRMEMNAALDQWQWQILILKFCQPVMEWFLQAALLAGLRTDGVSAVWTPPRRWMVDPVKETAALNLARKGGIMSLTEIWRTLGYDPEEMWDELEKEQIEVEKRKLNLG